MLSINSRPSCQGTEKEEKKERLTVWKIKTALVIMLIRREIMQNKNNFLKNTTTTTTYQYRGSQIIMELPVAVTCAVPVAGGPSPGNPGVDSPVGGNWIQDYMVWNHNHRQDNRQGPLQVRDMNKESKALMNPQF